MEYDENISEEKLGILEIALTDFLLGKKSIFETAQIFQSTIMTTKPLDRIATILQTPDAPIPNFSGMYMGSGGFNGNSNANTNIQRKKTRSWTEYEDQRLLAGIHKYGTDNWVTVAAFVGNGRTRAQCSQRWARGLDPRICKDKWTIEDEELLNKLVDQYGTKSWTRIAQEIGNRSDVQCRYHWKQMKQEMDLDSDSSSGVPIQNNPRHLNIQTSSISASNSGNLPILPNLLDSISPPQNRTQRRNHFEDKFSTSKFEFNNLTDDSVPVKISASGSLPACLNLAFPRNLAPDIPNFRENPRNENSQFKPLNKVDLPSINDLLSNVPSIYSSMKFPDSSVPLFDRSNSTEQNNISGDANNLGDGNN